VYFVAELTYFIIGKDSARLTKGDHCIVLEGSEASKFIFRYVGENSFCYPDPAVQFVQILLLVACLPGQKLQTISQE
jgi:hypothetical protein